MAIILRDVWALLAGFVVIMALVAASSLLLARVSPGFLGPSERPKPWPVLATMGTSLFASTAGGYVTAWVAEDNPLPRVLILAIVVLAISAISALDARGRKPVGLQLAASVVGAAGVVVGGI